MVIAFTIKENNYLMVKQFFDLVLTFLIHVCGIKFSWLRHFSCFLHSDKRGYGFPKNIHRSLAGAHQAELFSNKCFLYIQFCKLLWLWFDVDFF